MKFARDSLLLVAILLPLGCRNDAAPEAASPTPEATGTVTLEFELEGEQKSVTIENVASGTSLEEVMRRVESPEIEMSGSGTTAFVSRIGELDTGGREGWTFKVDGKFSPTGVGATMLNPPTTVSWRYGDFSPPSDESAQ